jgi:hypothetical protein
MARIIVTTKAAASIRALPKDRSLLNAIWRHLEWAADSPLERIEPPAFPHPWPMINFQAFDTAGQRWGVTALVVHEPEADTLKVIKIRAGIMPHDFESE